jgi:RNA polymerase sigma-70 factor (ECF subfamily)
LGGLNLFVRACRFNGRNGQSDERGVMKHADAVERFNQLVWPLRAAVLRVALIQCGNAAEADDLAQETLLKAFKAIDHFRPGTSLKAWLMTILRHTRIDRLRTTRASAKSVSLEALGTEPAGPENLPEPFEPGQGCPDDLLDQFADEQIIHALQLLPEDIRWTLLLVDVEQINQDEAALVLGVPLGTIKSRVHRGRGMLREALRPFAQERRLISE